MGAISQIFYYTHVKKDSNAHNVHGCPLDVIYPQTSTWFRNMAGCSPPTAKALGIMWGCLIAHAGVHAGGICMSLKLNLGGVKRGACVQMHTLSDSARRATGNSSLSVCSFFFGCCLNQLSSFLFPLFRKAQLQGIGKEHMLKIDRNLLGWGVVSFSRITNAPSSLYPQ